MRRCVCALAQRYVQVSTRQCLSDSSGHLNRAFPLTSSITDLDCGSQVFRVRRLPRIQRAWSRRGEFSATVRVYLRGSLPHTRRRRQFWRASPWKHAPGLADSIGQRLTVTQVIAVFTTYIIFIRVGLSLTPALAISFYITVKMIETKPVGVVAWAAVTNTPATKSSSTTACIFLKHSLLQSTTSLRKSGSLWSSCIIYASYFMWCASNQAIL